MPFIFSESDKSGHIFESIASRTYIYASKFTLIYPYDEVMEQYLTTLTASVKIRGQTPFHFDEISKSLYRYNFLHARRPLCGGKLCKILFDNLSEFSFYRTMNIVV